MGVYLVDCLSVSVPFLSTNTADALNPTTGSVSGQQEHKAERIRGGTGIILVGPSSITLPSVPLSCWPFFLFTFRHHFPSSSEKHLLIVYHQAIVHCLGSCCTL